jgi:hypothetical protein
MGTLFACAKAANVMRLMRIAHPAIALTVLSVRMLGKLSMMFISAQDTKRQRRAIDELRRMWECNSARRWIPESCLLQAISLAHGKARGRKQMSLLYSDTHHKRRPHPRHDGRGASE